MTIRFAFAGFDHWYNAFPTLEALLQDRAVEVVALSHHNPVGAAFVSERFGMPCGTNYDDVFGRGDVDAVCIFASTDQNAALATRALESGKAVVAIKPIGMTLAEADALVETAARTRRAYFPNDAARRFSPATVQFREWIEEGRIGDLVSVHCAFRAGLPQAWPRANGPGWFADPTRHPGGAFIDHAVYHVDVLRWFLGSEVESVTAVMANIRHSGIAVEDYGHAVFRFASGRIGSIEDTWTAGPGASRETIEIVGTRGSLVMDSATGKMAVTADFGMGGWIQAAPPPARGGFIRHVVRVLAGEEEPVSSEREARANLAACLAAYEAARSGAAVRL